MTKKLKPSHHRPKVYKNNKDQPINANLAKSNPDEGDSPYSIVYGTKLLLLNNNNYRAAAIASFRAMAYKKLSESGVKLKFDKEMCMKLVNSYDLSCVDCKLECEMHKWEALK